MQVNQEKNTLSTGNRTFISAFISFFFYFSWTYWVNALISVDLDLILRSAIIQGIYSALMTAGFTILLTFTLKLTKCHSLPYLAILPPLLIQVCLVIFINLLNQTPNLIATITPSIFFTTLYSFLYCFSLLKTPALRCDKSDNIF